jgi:hypothetical protein
MPKQQCDRCKSNMGEGESYYPYSVIEFKTYIDKYSTSTRYYSLCKRCSDKFKNELYGEKII